MVKGLDVFREYFKEYVGNYVIIGGTATGILLKQSGLRPRATKDIDAILIIEALTKEFGQRFWDFVRDGKYEKQQTSKGKTQYYRFVNPGNEDFPYMVELFSRKPDVIELPAGYHLTPVPLDEELSSLSAILLDDQYYHYCVDRTVEIDELNFVREESLVILKAKAYMNNLERLNRGEKVRSEDIRKHKNDIYRIMVNITRDMRYEVPEEIREDLRKFVAMLRTDGVGTRDISKEMGIQEVPFDIFLENFSQIFGL